MAYWAENPIEERSNRTVPLSREHTSTGPRSLLPWVSIAAAGVFLGMATLGATSLPSELAPLFLLAALSPFVAMMVGNVRKLLLGLILLNIPFKLDIHLGYLEEPASLGAIGGLGISITTLSLALLYALWLADLLMARGDQPRPWLGASLPLALYVALAAMSVAVAHNATLSLFEVFILVQTLLLYIYVASNVRSRDDVLFVVTVLLAGLALEGLLMLVMLFVPLDFRFAGISARSDAIAGVSGRFYRIAGTLGAPNAAASYLATLLPLAIAVLLAGLGRRHWALAGLALGVGGPALLLTFSRGGWAAFTVSVTVLALLAWRRGWLSPAFPIGIAAALALLALLFQDAVLARLSDAGAATGRLPLLRLALAMIQDNPVLGVGANNFAVAIEGYATSEFARAWLYVVHNKYLLVWSETGTAALAAFLWFLAATLRRGWGCWRSGDRFLALVALALAAAVAGQMVHMLADIFNNRQQVQLLWVVAGLMAAMSRIDGRWYRRVDV